MMSYERRQNRFLRALRWRGAPKPNNISRLTATPLIVVLVSLASGCAASAPVSRGAVSLRVRTHVEALVGQSVVAEIGTLCTWSVWPIGVPTCKTEAAEEKSDR